MRKYRVFFNGRNVGEYDTKEAAFSRISTGIGANHVQSSVGVANEFLKSYRLEESREIPLEFTVQPHLKEKQV